jgi:hypothetical protein
MAHFGVVAKKSDHPNLLFTALFQEEYVLSVASPDTLADIVLKKLNQALGFDITSTRHGDRKIGHLAVSCLN